MKNFLKHLKQEIGNNTKSPFTFSMVTLFFVLEPLAVLLYDPEKIFQPFEAFILFRALNFYIIVFIFLIIKFIFKSAKKNA
jgi:hypothetical protein